MLSPRPERIMRGGAAARTARSRKTPQRRGGGQRFLVALLGDGGADRGVAVHRGRGAEDDIGLAVEEGRVFAEIVDRAGADGDQGIGLGRGGAHPRRRSRHRAWGCSASTTLGDLRRRPRPATTRAPSTARVLGSQTTARRGPRPEAGQKRGLAAREIRGDRHLAGRHRQRPGAVGIGQRPCQQPLHQRLAHARASSWNIGFSAANRRR